MAVGMVGLQLSGELLEVSESLPQFTLWSGERNEQREGEKEHSKGHC